MFLLIRVRGSNRIKRYFLQFCSLRWRRRKGEDGWAVYKINTI